MKYNIETIPGIVMINDKDYLGIPLFIHFSNRGQGFISEPREGLAKEISHLIFLLQGISK
jgi:hypothetical protein